MRMYVSVCVILCPRHKLVEADDVNEHQAAVSVSHTHTHRGINPAYVLIARYRSRNLTSMYQPPLCLFCLTVQRKEKQKIDDEINGLKMIVIMEIPELKK